MRPKPDVVVPAFRVIGAIDPAMSEPIHIYFEDHKASTDLGRVALRGGLVSVAMKYGSGILQIISAIILARLLAPEDFGLVAIVAVLTGFAPMLIDFGLGDAIAQRQSITPGQVSTLFWVSCGLGLVVAVGVVVCSPLMAWLYGEPRLKLIMMSLAVSFALSGMSNQHLALLKRSMQFGRFGSIQFLATLISVVVSISTAFYGFGYWALVLRPITTALCVVIGAWSACRWRPGPPVFDDEARAMIRFGMHVSGFTVAYTVTKAVDRIALGLFYPVQQVGYYQNAMNLYDNSISSVLEQTHNVGSSALAKFQSNPAILKEKFKAALSMLAFFVMPASAILSVTAEDLTVILLGQKWHTTGFLLSILALRGIFHPIEGSQGWLHLALGRADRWMNWGIISLITQIAAVLCGLPFGAEGVAVAVVFASAILSVPSVAYAGRPIGLGAAAVLRAAGPQMMASVVIVAVGWWLQTRFLGNFLSYQRIVISACFGGCIYLAVIIGLFQVTAPIKVAVKVFRDLIEKLSSRPARG